MPRRPVDSRYKLHAGTSFSICIADWVARLDRCSSVQSVQAWSLPPSETRRPARRQACPLTTCWQGPLHYNGKCERARNVAATCDQRLRLTLSCYNICPRCVLGSSKHDLSVCWQAYRTRTLLLLLCSVQWGRENSQHQLRLPHLSTWCRQGPTLAFRRPLSHHLSPPQKPASSSMWGRCPTRMAEAAAWKAQWQCHGVRSPSSFFRCESGDVEGALVALRWLQRSRGAGAV